jgi:penicillin-binding protein 2
MDEYQLRVRIFIGIIVLVLGILALRLVQMQLIKTEEYAGTSRNATIREVRVMPDRGVLYDRNGILMVDNAPTYTLTLTPRFFDTTRVAMLAQLLEVPDTTVRRKIREARSWSSFRSSPLFPEISFDKLSRILENQQQLPGIGYEVTRKRRYLTNAYAAHVLGYIREISDHDLETRRAEGYRPGDLIGQSGLEKFYEQELRGQLGSHFRLVNRHGMEVESYLGGTNDRAPVGGYDLHLSIDSRMQAVGESLFVHKRGAAVAIDPNTGEILALISKPDFDPDIFSKPVDRATWNYLTTSREKPMFNRATMAGMPPGSTWKPFMALMALQEGLITPTTKLYCRGGVQVGNRFYKCMGVHGSLDVGMAIQRSCNSFFYQLMLKTDVNTYARYAHLFGFGLEAPMDIAEQWKAVIPDSAYFNRIFGQQWGLGTTVILGIGQGNMIVTPMQLARYLSAVANGGTLHAPHLVREMKNPETGEVLRPNLPRPQRLPIDAAYFEIVRDGMRRVMEAGTGRGVQLPDIPSGGKTGTAQAPGFNRKDNSVFVMFAPFDQPKVVIAVMVENGGFGAQQAAPIGSLMVEQYLTGHLTRRDLFNHIRTLSSQSL